MTGGVPLIKEMMATRSFRSTKAGAAWLLIAEADQDHIPVEQA
jgi:hypothetical protein